MSFQKLWHESCLMKKEKYSNGMGSLRTTEKKNLLSAFFLHLPHLRLLFTVELFSTLCNSPVNKISNRICLGWFFSVKNTSDS